ncbi:MAG: hypothetical protein Q4B17_06200 [Lautropia sp.]|nr:hypothetical protein [Lautropia sp.]
MLRSSVLMALGLMAASAQGATPRADIARPTDFDQVEPGTSVLQCKSGSLMTCGRQATGRMKLPKGSGPKTAYRFVEEEFMFDTGVGIFLQTAIARDRDQHMEWRRRLAFRKGTSGGFQLLQVGLQYRCGGGEWSKVACKPASQKQARVAEPKSQEAEGSKAAAGSVSAASDATVRKGESAAAASGRTGVKGPEAARPTPAPSAADAAVAKATAEAEVRKADASAQTGQDLAAAGKPQDAGLQGRPPLNAQWRPLGQQASAQPDTASSSGQDVPTAAAAGAGGAGAGGERVRGSMDDAIRRAEQADVTPTRPASASKTAPAGAGNVQAEAAQPDPLKADGARGVEPSAPTQPKTVRGEGEVTADTGDILSGTRSATGPGGLIRLMPTLPASVRTARGFSPLVLSTEDAVRLSKPCEQPIELCGQQVFDEVFSPESYADLAPEQIQRESFIYADSPITSGVYLVTMVNLPDDSLAAERIRIEFARRGSAWMAVSAARQMRCRRGESAVPSDWTDKVCP